MICTKARGIFQEDSPLCGAGGGGGVRDMLSSTVLIVLSISVYVARLTHLRSSSGVSRLRAAVRERETFRRAPGGGDAAVRGAVRCLRSPSGVGRVEEYLVGGQSVYDHLERMLVGAVVQVP